MDREFAWAWDILDEPRVDTRPVHLGVGGGGHNLQDGLGNGVTLGNPLCGGGDVICALPHGEQMRVNCSLQSLPPCPLRLSSIEHIIWGNNAISNTWRTDSKKISSSSSRITCSVSEDDVDETTSDNLDEELDDDLDDSVENDDVGESLDGDVGDVDMASERGNTSER